MSVAPERCLYCDGTDPNCGFCDMGKPLDTQEDWDNSWGHTFESAKRLTEFAKVTATTRLGLSAETLAWIRSVPPSDPVLPERYAKLVLPVEEGDE